MEILNERYDINCLQMQPPMDVTSKEKKIVQRKQGN